MTYEEFKQSAPVVMAEFYATWCPHCRKMQPIVEQVAELVNGQAVVEQFDVDEYQDLCEEERITGTPTFILYHNGREVWRHSGEIEGRALLSEIERYLNRR